MHGSDDEANAETRLRAGAPESQRTPPRWTRLPEGEVVARRYQIEALIGSGGMADVYRARDLVAGGTIALKVLDVDREGTRVALSSLRREITAARRLAHPSVVRAFDVGLHEDAHRCVAFISMELVDGETLAERLRRDGPLPAAVAVPLLTRLASALDAAHAVGIVHRDVKPHNVLLAAVEGETRPLLTDFGISSLVQATLQSGTETIAGGTPEYMAPEQLGRRPVTAAADLYSFGVVVAETLTGHRPEGPLERGRSLPAHAALSVEARRVIGRCLAIDPKDRPRTASEVVASLSSRAGLARRAVRVALVVAVALAVWPAVEWLREQGVGGAPDRVTLVLAPSSAGAGGQLAAILADAATDAMTAGGTRVVWSETTSSSASASLRAGEWRVRITTSSAADSLRLEITESAEAAPRVVDIPIESERPDAALSAALLELHADAPAWSASLGSLLEERGLPRGAEAQRHHLRAALALTREDLVEAAREVAAGEQTSPSGLAVRSMLLSATGRDREAQLAAADALAQGRALPRESRIELEVLAHRVGADWGRAIEAQRLAIALRPGDLRQTLALADLLYSAARYAEAKDVLEKMRASRELRDDGRIALLYGATVFRLGAQAEGAAEIERGLQLARGRRLLGMVARGLTIKNGARPVDALQRCEESRTITEKSGDSAGVLRAIFCRTSALTNLSRLDEARAEMDRPEVKQVLQDDSALTIQALSRLGFVAKRKGNYAEARGYFQRELEIARREGQKARLWGALVELAGLELDSDHAEVAVPLYVEAIALAKSIGQKHDAALALQNLALHHLRAGELFRAQEVAAESLSLYREIRDGYDIAWTLDTVGNVDLEMGNANNARAAFEEAIKVRLGNGIAAGQSRKNLARSLAALGRWSEALAEAKLAVEELEAMNQLDSAVSALQSMSDIAVEMGEIPTARAALDRALALGDAEQQQLTARELVATRAMVEFAEGRRRHAIQLLEQALAGPALGGAEELEARMALGSTLLRGGRPERGRQLLTEVIAEARKTGRLQMVRDASRRMQQGP